MAVKKDPGKKMSVGGLHPEVTKDTIREYSGELGESEAIELVIDAKRNKRRGFVLITFKEQEPAEKVLEEKVSTISGDEREVKVGSPRRCISSSGVALGAAVVAMGVALLLAL